MTRASARLIRASNPITNRQGSQWQRSGAASAAFEHLVYSAAEDATTRALELPHTRRRAQTSRVAIAVGAVALVLGLLTLVMPSDKTNRPTSQRDRPATLQASPGEDYVWTSPSGMTQAAAAFDFVQSALGRAARPVGQAPDPAGPSWFDSRTDGSDLIEFLLAPRGEGWVVLQVGAPPAVRVDSRGSVISLEDFGAESATVMFFADGANGRAEADATTIEAGELVLVGVQDVDSVLVLYRDGSGRVVDARGGVFSSVP